MQPFHETSCEYLGNPPSREAVMCRLESIPVLLGKLGPDSSKATYGPPLYGLETDQICEMVREQASRNSNFKKKNADKDCPRSCLGAEQ